MKIAHFVVGEVFGGGRGLRSKCGTEMYMAPEVFEEGNEEYAGPPVDMFACGVIFFIMLLAK